MLFFLSALDLSAITLEVCDKMIKKGIETMLKEKHEESLKILTEAKIIAQGKRWYRQEFRATNNIGANYYMMLDYGEALENYLEAYKIAIAHLDIQAEMTVLNNIAILYSKEKKPHKAEEYFLKAYLLAKKTNDSTKIGLYAINMATILDEKKQFDKAFPYVGTALKFTQKSNFSILAKVVQIENLVYKKNYTEAKVLSKLLLPEIKNISIAGFETSFYFNLSKIAREENNLPMAFSYLRKASSINHNLEDKIKLFLEFSNLYRKSGNMEKAFSYRDSMMIINDSVNEVKNGKLFENSRIKFELQNSRKELNDNKKSRKHERIVLLSGITLLLLLTGIFVWALRISILKNEQHKIIEHRNQEISALEIEKEKSKKKILENQLREKEIATAIEQQKLKNEIELKNRKLTSKALELSNKKEIIEGLVSHLSRQPDILDNVYVKNAIKELKLMLRKNFEEDGFLSHFEEVNQGFLQRLKQKHSELNTNDIRFLSYIYMNLSFKEISFLFNITPEACRKRKERIMRKMKLKEKEDIYSYISII